jgi:hypothetical protein
MSVTQISKITVRKGRKENLPQLSGGEFGWAVDTQQLYIGNGALEEGAPAEGNTEIITERNVLGINNTFTEITLFDNTSSETAFYTFDYASHPAGILQYSIQRNGAWRAGQITYAYGGSGSASMDDWNTGGSLGVDLTVAVDGTNMVFRYTTTSSGYDATLKIKRVDYL